MSTCRYLGNKKTKEVHDLHNQQINCQIPEIRPENQQYFPTLAAALAAGYNGCYYCPRG